MAGPSSSMRPVKMKVWGGLQQRWKLLGVFEINQQHELYQLTCMMKEGLATAVQNTIDNPIPVSNKNCNKHLFKAHVRVQKKFCRRIDL